MEIALIFRTCLGSECFERHPLASTLEWGVFRINVYTKNGERRTENGDPARGQLLHHRVGPYSAGAYLSDARTAAQLWQIHFLIFLLFLNKSARPKLVFAFCVGRAVLPRVCVVVCLFCAARLFVGFAFVYIADTRR